MGLIDKLIAQSTDTQRKAALEATHPVYKRHVHGWKIGLDAYDGSGGFMDGGYLWRFERENDAQIKARRGQARYHNYTETLVDIYVRNVTTGIERQSTSEALNAWWADVDGQGADMTHYMASAFGQALAVGHAAVLMDKAAELPEGPSRAEDTRPYVATFDATEIYDWRIGRNGLEAIKLSEEAPPVDLGDAIPDPGWLLWDQDRWARFDHQGRPLGVGEHGLGVVPIQIIRPKPSRRHPFIGKALVPPSVVQALFNRASEEDLVLRDQAFSLFVVQLPVDATQDDVDLVQTRLNSGVGTTTALVIKGTSDFQTADMAVPKAIQENQAALIHEMYRMAHLRFQRDSLDAESAEALRLQRHDLDSTLRGMAEDLAMVEEQLAWLFFAWTTPDADRAFEQAEVSIAYPSEFSLVNLEQELTAVAAAVALDLGDTATRELKKRAVMLALPDLSDETLETVQAEIENAPQGVRSPAQSLREAARQRLQEAGVEVTDDQEAA